MSSYYFLRGKLKAVFSQVNKYVYNWLQFETES